MKNGKSKEDGKRRNLEGKLDISSVFENSIVREKRYGIKRENSVSAFIRYVRNYVSKMFGGYQQ